MITVTGANGFVGRQIVNALHAKKEKIRIIVRNAQDLSDDMSKKVDEIVESTDLFSESKSNLNAILEGTTVLIHAAWYAEHGKYLDSPANLDCLQGTIELARAFVSVGGRRFVGIGTCAEYDLKNGVLDTNVLLNPGSLYAACKASAYYALLQYLAREDISFVWCRLFYLYGEGEDERRLVPYLRKQLAAGEPVKLTSGNQIRDFLDVRDAGEMIARIAIGDRVGAFNICSGIPVTIKQLAERISNEYGRYDLLKFGERPENLFDPPCVVGVKRED